VASQAWDAVVDALEAMDCLHTVDGLALYQYAALYGETEGIRAQQDRYRATVDTLESALDGLTGSDLGQAVQQIAGLAKLDSKCTDQLRAGRTAIRLFLLEFGLTPASRNRIRLPEDAPADADQFAALAGKRPA
jgi:phage terminase small subunit